METAFTFFLSVHIASGFSAFVAAPIAMMMAKGGKKHRLWGKIFFWCMTGVVLSAFVMSVLHKNPFLFMVAGFSYYLVASGYRWLYRKQAVTIKDVATFDWVLLIGAAVFNLGLFGFGVYGSVTNPQNSFGYIAMVFACVGLRFVWTNYKSFINPPKTKYAWLLHHMGGMIGGYIATVSAFSAVNFDFLPTIIQWLWPTIIGVPLLLAWINYYKRKFNRGLRVEEVVEVKSTAEEMQVEPV